MITTLFSYRNICDIVLSERCVCVSVCKYVYCCVPWPGPHRHMKLPYSRFLPKAADVDKHGAGVPQPDPTCLPRSYTTGWWAREASSLPLPWMKWELKTLLSLQEGTFTWVLLHPVFDGALFCHQPQSQNWSYETRRIWIKLFIEVLKGPDLETNL